MSNTETVAALKTAFAGYENNDRGPLTALLADDFTFEMSDSVPCGGTYVGLEEFAAFWQEVGKEWRYCRYDAHEAQPEQQAQRAVARGRRTAPRARRGGGRA